MDLFSDETHAQWAALLDVSYPFQVDLPYQLTGPILAAIVKFCEPHDVWSASEYRSDGLECMRVGFKDARVARNFRRKFSGEIVERQTVH